MTTGHGIERDLMPPASLRIAPASGLRIVRQGSAALFAHHETDAAIGPRHYVAALGPGDPVFAGVPVDGGACTFVLVAVDPVRFVEYADGLETAPIAADTAAGLVDRWRAIVAPLLRGAEPVPADAATPEAALGQVQEALTRRLAAIDLEESARRDRQRARRADTARSTTDHVFDRLAATVLGATSPASGLGGSPLAVALEAIGAELGLRLAPPTESDQATTIDEELKAICRASRVHTRHVLLVDRWWEQDHGPLLAFTLDGGHPVALLPRGPSAYALVDPRGAGRPRVDAQVAATLAPTAVLVYRQLPAGRVTPLGLMRFALAGRRLDLSTALVCALAATGLNMLWPAATGLIVDAAVPDADRALLGELALGLVAAAAGRALFALAQAAAFTRIQVGASAYAQPAMWDRVLSLRLRTLRQYTVGDLQTRVGIVTALSEILSGATLRVVFAGVLSLLNLLVMPVYSPALTLVALAIGVPVVALTVTSGAGTLRVSRRLQALAGRSLGLSVQLINGVSKLQMAGAEGRAFAEWGHLYAGQQALARDARAIQDRVTLINQVLPTLATAVLFAMAGMWLRSGDTALTAGRFLAFSGLFGTFLGAATAFSNTMIEVIGAASLWRRAQPLLDADPEVDATKTAPGRLAGAVELERIRFRYGAGGPLTLSDVSIRADAGEFIALVGPSGGGKSTILRLILGFDTPESGAVLLDGQDLAGLDVQAVRRQFGVVLQSSRPISGSIFENVACGAVITLSRAWEALRAAGLADDVNEWPMGIHTYVSENGGNLSGGQRQRLLIARALVHAPAVLIFDEATSALDNRTQASVSESLERLGVTRIVIAHRLSTIRRADRIYVIDRGRLVQTGTFDELAGRTGLFQQLIARQAM